MDVISRGISNAFRNATRTISIVSILGLSIGLSLVMLVAHQAVNKKIKTTLSSIGTTIHIQPAGYNGGSGVNMALTNAQLDKIKKLTHITKVAGMLNSMLQTEGTTSQPQTPAGADSQTQSNAPQGSTTNLKAPYGINCNKGSCTGGGMGFSSGGSGPAPKLPSNFSLPISVAGTNQPTDPAVINASTFQLLSGKVFDGNKDADEALISQAMATKNNLHVGSTFKAFDRTLKVVGIFKADTQAGNSTIIVPLSALQRYTKQTGLITNAVATVDSLENLDSATKATQKALGSAADVNSPLDEANKAIQPLRSVQSISLYSLIGSVAAGAVIILLTMIMIVRERKREIGVLKAIGFSNLRIMFQFMNEALTLTVLAAFVGLIVGILAANPVTSALVKNTGSGNTGGPGGSISFGDSPLSNLHDVQAAVGWEVVAFGFGAAVLIALFGSALASFFIAKVRPAEVLRSE